MYSMLLPLDASARRDGEGSNVPQDGTVAQGLTGRLMAFLRALVARA